jgi:hypothetical protein
MNRQDSGAAIVVGALLGLCLGWDPIVFLAFMILGCALVAVPKR